MIKIQEKLTEVTETKPSFVDRMPLHVKEQLCEMWVCSRHWNPFFQTDDRTDAFGKDLDRLNEISDSIRNSRMKMLNEGSYYSLLNYITEKRDFHQFHKVMAPYMDMTDEDYWSMVKSRWINCEMFFDKHGTWKKLFNDPKRIKSRHLFFDFKKDGMNPETGYPYEGEDKSLFDSLPETVTVYRGSSHSTNRNGWSWTTDRTKGEWFARRLTSKGKSGYLWTGTVNKNDILGYFHQRNESEVVTFPKKVTVIKQERILKEII